MCFFFFKQKTAYEIECQLESRACSALALMGVKRQHGGVGIMILMLMVLLIVGYLASYSLYRVTTAGHERDQTTRVLAVAAAALDQFAAANARLPCPADPTADTGLEAPSSAARGSFDTGTLPSRR